MFWVRKLWAVPIGHPPDTPFSFSTMMDQWPTKQLKGSTASKKQLERSLKWREGGFLTKSHCVTVRRAILNVYSNKWSKQSICIKCFPSPLHLLCFWPTLFSYPILDYRQQCTKPSGFFRKDLEFPNRRYISRFRNLTTGSNLMLFGSCCLSRDFFPKIDRLQCFLLGGAIYSRNTFSKWDLMAMKECLGK